MTHEGLIAPVRHDGRLRMQAGGLHRGEGANDVGIAVRADQPAHVGEADNRIDLANHLVGGEGRAGVDQHGLVTLLDQVDVTLEVVARQQRSDPPDAWRELERTSRVYGVSSAHGPTLQRFNGGR